MSLSCSLESSVPDWLLTYPETAEVFDELGLDESCGGKSLERLCRERGLDPEAVFQRLRSALEQH